MNPARDPQRPLKDPNLKITLHSHINSVQYLAVTVISISSHEVDAVAVFIPEGALIGQGTVGDSNVIVVVISGEWTTMVIGHGVT